ncbi:MAG: CoA pyrophosphatase [Desulfobacterales bacterium]|nr:CoA pyrophosphatase [Desulfobacterales bacterium]
MEQRLADGLKRCLGKSHGILGWERFIHSAVLAPLIKIDGELHLLFQKRTQGIRQGGEISFPGGLFDPVVDESLRMTALRECHEEMGIEPRMVHVVGELDPLVAPAGITVSCFVGLLEKKSLETMVVNPDEVESWFTLPLSFFQTTPPNVHHVRLMVEPHFDHPKKGRVTLLPAEELGLPPRYHKPWGGLTREVYLWPTAHGTLWGLTSELVKEIVGRLEKGGVLV